MPTSNDEISRDIGRLEGTQEQMDRRLANIEVTVVRIDKAMSELDGGRRTALWMLGVFGAFSGAIGGFLSWVWSKL